MTDDPKSAEPKERILQAAIHLFSRKGYSATGMRELAREADVNLAMINYHFGSKQKLLEAVFDTFFTRQSEYVATVLDDDGPPEDRIRRAVHQLIEGFREQPDLVRVAFAELPYDVPEFADYKAQRIKEIVGRLLLHLAPLAMSGPRDFVPAAAAPAMIGMVAFHFLMRPVLQKIFDSEFDDDFYSEYPDRIVDLFLYGIIGHPPSTPSSDDDPEPTE